MLVVQKAGNWLLESVILNVRKDTLKQLMDVKSVITTVIRAKVNKYKSMIIVFFISMKGREFWSNHCQAIYYIIFYIKDYTILLNTMI